MPKTVKKYLAAIMSFLMIVSFNFPTIAKAGTPDFTITAGSVAHVAQGGTISVPVTLTNGGYFSYFGFMMQYDPAYLTFTGFTTTGTSAPEPSKLDVSTSFGPNLLQISYLPDNGAVVPAGTIINLNFTVANTGELTARNTILTPQDDVNSGFLDAVGNPIAQVQGYVNGTVTIDAAPDLLPPAAPVVSGVTEAGSYISAVTPTWTDPAGVTSVATLAKDGGTAANYTSGTAISADGAYTLVVTATKTANGLTAVTTIHFTVDASAPPTPVVIGVVEGNTYATVTPTWVDPAGVTSVATLAKDGGAAASYSKGIVINTDGAYTLEVIATKTSNNMTSTTTIHFTVDTNAPAALVVAGVVNGTTYATSVTPTWTNPAGVTSVATLAKNGGTAAAYTSGTAITADGAYTLVVTATKTTNGLTAVTTVNFTVDTVAPAVPTVTGVIDGRTYSTVSPTWVDPSGVTSVATLALGAGAPEPYIKGTAITTDGTYTLVVTAIKAANGLTATKTITFTIDSNVPSAPVVTGVTNATIYGTSVTPTWTDVAGVTTAATLAKDGGTAASYAKGTAITADGVYVLTVTATKTSNGLTNETVVNFTIDTTAPLAPVVAGVTNATTYGTSVTPTWPNVAGVTTQATLTKDNGTAASYTSGTAISVDGSYVLEVTATKTSNGLTAKTTVNFVIDTVAPSAPAISGVTNGTTSTTAVTPTWTNPTGVTSVATLAKDGGTPATYTSGTAISENGAYVLVVTATKTANGLIAITTVNFSIDKDAPATVTIGGVTNNQIVNLVDNTTGVSPTWSDAMGTTSTAKLDGVDYTPGTAINTVGNHTLVVTTTKTANGLTSTTTVNFVIVPFKVISTGTATIGTDTVTLGKSATTPVKVSVKIAGTYNKAAVVVFQLKDSNGVAKSIVAIETLIDNDVVSAIFADAVPAGYTVDVMVLDSLTNSLTQIGNILSAKVNVQ